MTQRADTSPESRVSHDHDGATGSDPAMAESMEGDIRRRFWVALALTVPLVLLSGTVPGIPALVRAPAADWIGFVLATPVVWWCGWMFLAGAVTALRRLTLDMSVLIATGVLAAYLASVYLTVIRVPATYYDAAAMLVTFVLFGHWMEMKSRRGTTDALRALFALVPPTARLLRAGQEVGVPTAEVVVGDSLRLRPGDKIPVDGDLVERVAKEVGIARVFAEVRPEQKADYVQRLQREGQVTAMVGDGVNDAPALAQADIGIAIGAGTDVAIQAAEVVLMKSDPADVAHAIRLSRATVRKMKQNLAWATVYNVLAIPVAAGVFYHSLGWMLAPQVSALLMSGSSIFVAVNAVSLRRARI
ncbi:MAG: HAD-IC family P-type ATPase [Polyangiaceae bacterium]